MEMSAASRALLNDLVAIGPEGLEAEVKDQVSFLRSDD